MTRRTGRAALLGLLVLGASAHVGSPAAIFDGAAGVYPVRVVVRPPDVIPGKADVSIRILSDAPVSRVGVRAVFQRTGRAGSPPAEPAARVAGSSQLFATTVWLMAPGAYTIEVDVAGSAGAGSVAVPVTGVPTAEATLGPALTGILCVLGALLVAGLLSIVHAAAGEAITPPGEAVTDGARRRARLAVGVAVPVVLLMTVGGWRWWQAEATAYRATLDRPMATHAAVIGATSPRLEFAVTDSAWLRPERTPLVPDHGKLMHMFAIAERDGAAFAHLHPVRIDERTFETALPPLPPGRYHLFGDVVHESGIGRTLVGRVVLPPPPPRGRAAGMRDAAAGGALDPDDAWHVTGADAPAADGRTGAVAAVPGGTLVRLDADRPLRAGTETVLRFALRDVAGDPVALEPYMGMDGHAVILRSDASVFIHLHPMGTVPVGAQANGMAAHADHRARATTVAFPYEFPRAGRYMMWVQVKRRGEVVTGRYSVVVD